MRIAWIEILICMTIIAVSVAIGLSVFQNYINVARVQGAVCEALGVNLKVRMSVYHALTGNWPSSIDQMNDLEFSAWYGRDKDSELSVDVENGAINVKLKPPLSAYMVTVRPAVTITDPLGPVVWFVGEPQEPDDWAIAGTDRTTAPIDYIHPRMR